MILYHGSNVAFKTPLLSKCSPHKDFAVSELQKQMIEFSTMDLVSAVAASRKLSPTEAMAVVYKSSFFEKLQDPETGLYRESKAYLLRRFQKESEPATGGSGS